MNSGVVSTCQEPKKLLFTFEAATPPTKQKATDWVKAPEFVPGQKWIPPPGNYFD